MCFFLLASLLNQVGKGNYQGTFETTTISVAASPQRTLSEPSASGFSFEPLAKGRLRRLRRALCRSSHGGPSMRWARGRGGATVSVGWGLVRVFYGGRRRPNADHSPVSVSWFVSGPVLFSPFCGAVTLVFNGQGARCVLFRGGEDILLEGCPFTV